MPLILENVTNSTSSNHNGDSDHSSVYYIANSGGARVFAARSKRLCCRPHLRNQISNWYSYGTTMALVWTVNSTLSWGVKFQNSIFLPVQMPPPVQCRPGGMPSPFRPRSRRHWLQSAVNTVHCMQRDVSESPATVLGPDFQKILGQT